MQLVLKFDSYAAV